MGANEAVFLEGNQDFFSVDVYIDRAVSDVPAPLLARPTFQCDHRSIIQFAEDPAHLRLKKLRIQGFRSLRDETLIHVPANLPLVFIGENNAGKSNIVRALDIVLGETWPTSREPEDHDFWSRAPAGQSIEIEVGWEDLTDEYGKPIEGFVWRFDPAIPSEPCTFSAYYPSGASRRPSKALRSKCFSLVIGADRRLSYQLSYTSKWTFLSKLMRKFHERLVSDSERVERLKKEFQKIVTIFKEVSEFKTFEDGLVKNLGTMLEGMSYALSVDFSAYDPSNFFHSLRVLPHENGEARSFDELGTGQEQVLALVFAHAYARAFYGGIVLVIEEPEAHLHPLAQDWLSRKIGEMTKDGLQVILTTHSPAFVNLLGLEGIVLVRKIDGATKVRQLRAHDLAEYCKSRGSDPVRTTAERVLPFYANSATESIIAGLFAQRVVLVEGPTEESALPIYLDKAGLDVLQKGVAILSVWGKGNLAKWWRFFTAYGIPAYVIFDNDAKNDSDGTKRRDALKTMGMQDDEVNGAVTAADWIIAERYSVFGNDFESTLRKLLPGYEDLEKDAIQELGSDSKPLIAKFVAERIELPDESEGAGRFRTLAQKIHQLALEHDDPFIA